MPVTLFSPHFKERWRRGQLPAADLLLSAVSNEGATAKAGGQVIKRRTRIVVETQEVMVIRRKGLDDARQWCPACAREVRMITPEQAALILSSTTRTIYSWVEAAIVHFREQPEGSLLICLDSLPVD